MPLFMDIHEAPGATREDLAKGHAADVAIQSEFGVEYHKYWLNRETGKIFCLCTAPSADAAREVHAKAHGMMANRLIEVTTEVADLFMGGTEIDLGGAATVPGTKNNELDPGTRSILFTDIVGSTDMTQRLGDLKAMEILGVHDDIVREALQEEGGREVKHLGDGIMAAFNAAVSAIRCGISIQKHLRENHAPDLGENLRVRIGIAAGQPVERGNDLFGSTVQLAARLCAFAEPEQIVVSRDVVGLCKDTQLMLEELGPISLKGFSEPVNAHRVNWQLA